MRYEVVFQLGTSSATSEVRQVVEAPSQAQAQAIVEAQYNGQAWVKRVSQTS
jgi:hypothetical protein